eukprot:2779772-Pyramimonas_sp.AAC.1
MRPRVCAPQRAIMLRVRRQGARRPQLPRRGQWGCRRPRGGSRSRWGSSGRTTSGTRAVFTGCFQR